MCGGLQEGTVTELVLGDQQRVNLKLVLGFEMADEPQDFDPLLPGAGAGPSIVSERRKRAEDEVVIGRGERRRKTTEDSDPEVENLHLPSGARILGGIDNILRGIDAVSTELVKVEDLSVDRRILQRIEARMQRIETHLVQADASRTDFRLQVEARQKNMEARFFNAHMTRRTDSISPLYSLVKNETFRLEVNRSIPDFPATIDALREATVDLLELILVALDIQHPYEDEIDLRVFVRAMVGIGAGFQG